MVIVIVPFLSHRHHRQRGGQTVKAARDEIFALAWELQPELHRANSRVIDAPAAVN
jgi:hypothetical protein